MSRVDAKRIGRVLGAGADAEAAAEARRGGSPTAPSARAWSTSPTPASTRRSGTGQVAATERGIVSVALPELRPRRRSSSSSASSRRGSSSCPQRLDEALRELDQYFDGDAARVRARARLAAWSAAGFTEQGPARDREAALWRHRELRRDRRRGRQPARLPGRRHGARPQPDPDRRPLPPGPAGGRRARQLRRRAGDEGVPAAARGRDRVGCQVDNRLAAKVGCQPCMSTRTVPTPSSPSASRRSSTGSSRGWARGRSQPTSASAATRSTATSSGSAAKAPSPGPTRRAASRRGGSTSGPRFRPPRRRRPARERDGEAAGAGPGRRRPRRPRVRARDRGGARGAGRGRARLRARPSRRDRRARPAGRPGRVGLRRQGALPDVDADPK